MYIGAPSHEVLFVFMLKLWVAPDKAYSCVCTFAKTVGVGTSGSVTTVKTFEVTQRQPNLINTP